MRVFPIVQTLARVAVGRQELQVGKSLDEASGDTLSQYNLPSGTNLIINSTAIHYNPDIWPSPEVIDPRRWLVSDPHSFDPAQPPTASQEAEIGRGTTSIPNSRRGTFLSFGEGPRACTGRSFARVEFLAIMSRLLRRHRLEMTDGDSNTAARVLKTARLRSGGSPITLIPPEDVRISLVKRN